MEIAPNVHKVIVGKLENNLYMVTGERAVFIDASPGTDEQLNALLNLWADSGRPVVAAIFLTHWHYDHTGGAEKLAKMTGGKIISNPIEQLQIETTMPGVHIDSTVTDGQTLYLGGVTLKFVYTPGHTAGSTSIYYKEQKILFTGDTVIRGSAGPFHIDPDTGDMGLHVKTLRKLQHYDISLIAPGHGPEVQEPSIFLEKELDDLTEADKYTYPNATK